MNSNFSKALRFVLQQECVYEKGHSGDLAFVTWEEVPGDAGGLTKWGIDQASHPHVDIKALTQTEASKIYYDEEWTKCRCNDLPDGYDIAVFDIAVNNGKGEAIQMLQRALNNCSAAQLIVDGLMGPATVNACTRAGEAGLARLLTERDNLYRTIVQRRPEDQKFLSGWMHRNAALAKLVNSDPEVVI